LTLRDRLGRFNEIGAERAFLRLLFNTVHARFVSAMMTRLLFSSGRPACFLAVCLTSLLLAEEALGQDRAVAMVEENLRAEPQGVVIGRVLEGTGLDVIQTQGRWFQVEIEGWIWNRSIDPTDRQGFDLVVSATPDENLRHEPSGEILARLLEGALLDRVEEGPAWTRVRRVAWVWGPSMDVEAEGSQAPGAEAPEAAGARATWLRTGSAGAPILSGPDGDTIAVGRPDVELQVLVRQGNWARVRLEGWVWTPAAASPDSAGASALSEATPEDVARDPEAHQGQLVEWDLQFISMEQAERVRTDFYEGEPFLLTRAVSRNRGFVYVAVPPERLGEIEGLIPLERIRVVGRIRTGAAALTGNPILDLMELTRLPRD